MSSYGNVITLSFVLYYINAVKRAVSLFFVLFRAHCILQRPNPTNYGRDMGTGGLQCGSNT